MGIGELRGAKAHVESALGQCSFIVSYIIVSLVQHDIWVDEWYSEDQEIEDMVVDTTAKILSIDGIPVLPADIPQDFVFGITPEMG